MTAQWVKYGTRSGWMELGSVPASAIGGIDFWSKVLRVVCAAEGGHVDMVQCYDLGIMSAGPIGATAQSGALAQLLNLIPFEIRQAKLGALFEQAGLGLSEKGFTKGIGPASHEDLKKAFLGGSDGWAWKESEKQVALAWVNALSSALRDPTSLRCIGKIAIPVLKPYVSALAERVFGMDGLFIAESPVIKRAIATWVSFSVNHPTGANRLLSQSGGVPGIPPTADAILEVASRASPLWPATFSQRVGRTRAALEKESW